MPHPIPTPHPPTLPQAAVRTRQKRSQLRLHAFPNLCTQFAVSLLTGFELFDNFGEVVAGLADLDGEVPAAAAAVVLRQDAAGQRFRLPAQELLLRPRIPQQFLLDLPEGLQLSLLPHFRQLAEGVALEQAAQGGGVEAGEEMAVGSFVLLLPAGEGGEEGGVGGRGGREVEEGAARLRDGQLIHLRFYYSIAKTNLSSKTPNTPPAQHLPPFSPPSPHLSPPSHQLPTTFPHLPDRVWEGVDVGDFQIINLIRMSDSRMSDHSLASAAALPKKQEWGLLYGHRALQLQQAKSMQKLLSEQKKQEFKRQLDAQISSKNSQGQAEKEADRRYYEMVTRQAQETKEKEQRDKFQKYLQRKQIEEQNQRSLLTALDPKREDFGKVYNIPIGLKSEQEKRERAETLRRDVVQTLDQQREQKEAMRRLSRLEESELDCRNAAIQQEQFSNRSLNSKKYEQNQAVFDYYRQLHQQKQRRNREIDEQLQEREQERKAQEDSRKREEEAAAKHKRTIEMRDTLEQQVEIHNHRKQEEGRPNPEQATYAFISNIFRERKAPFDKKEYSLFLERQAEQQRLSRRQQQFMSEEEYRLNANQLHRATSGHYPADHYHDRSMGTLGDKLALPAVQPLPSDDNELVKNKLDTLRSKRNRSMLHNPAEHADFV